MRNHDGQERKLISVEEMARMINSEIDIRDKAIVTLLAKTGIRRNELISLDVYDVDCTTEDPTQAHDKRTNRTVFFNDETAFILRRWLRVREYVNQRKETAYLDYVGIQDLQKWRLSSGGQGSRARGPA